MIKILVTGKILRGRTITMMADRMGPYFLWAEKVWEKLELKLRAECKRTGSNLPFIPIQGRYRYCMMPNGLWWWTNGFWPGILWQAYHATGDEQYRDTASGAGRRLAGTLSQPEKLEHDVGFIIKRIPMLEMSAKDFRQVIDIDLNGPFIVSKAVIPSMIKKGGGKIINIC